MTSPVPEISKSFSRSITMSIASKRRKTLSLRHSFANSTAERVRFPSWVCKYPSNFSNNVNASATEPAKPANILPLNSLRIFLALCFITTASPIVTWPSPLIAHSPLWRIAKIVVARICCDILSPLFLTYSLDLLVDDCSYKFVVNDLSLRVYIFVLRISFHVRVILGQLANQHLH